MRCRMQHRSNLPWLVTVQRCGGLDVLMFLFMLCFVHDLSSLTCSSLAKHKSSSPPQVSTPALKSLALGEFGTDTDLSLCLVLTQQVILYEMGSGSTQAALVKYSTYGKSKSSQTNQFEVLDVAWDHSLGSNSLDLLLLKHFADEFKQKGGDDIRWDGALVFVCCGGRGR